MCAAAAVPCEWAVLLLQMLWPAYTEPAEPEESDLQGNIWALLELQQEHCRFNTGLNLSQWTHWLKIVSGAFLLFDQMSEHEESTTSYFKKTSNTFSIRFSKVLGQGCQMSAIQEWHKSVSPNPQKVEEDGRFLFLMEAKIFLIN